MSGEPTPKPHPAYEYLEDVATADAAFKAWGETLEDLFRSASTALLEIMVDTSQIEPKVTKVIGLENEDIENLLYDFLSELIYLKDAEGLLFSRFEVKITRNKTYRLEARVSGAEIDREKFEMRSDAKAVTYHLFEVKRLDGGWRATVVVDI